jgi:hypothetical protein
MNLFTPAKKMGERMIMAVFRRPVLWNMRNDIYGDKNKTNQAWKEIGEEFGLPCFVKNIKTFIRYLRKTTAKVIFLERILRTYRTEILLRGGVSEEKRTLRRIT